MLALIGRSLPDMTEPFKQFAAGLKSKAKAQDKKVFRWGLAQQVATRYPTRQITVLIKCQRHLMSTQTKSPSPTGRGVGVEGLMHCPAAARRSSTGTARSL